MSAAGNRGLVFASAGIALLLAATLAAYRPPAPLGPDAPPGTFSAFRAGAILRDLVGNGVPHPIGSPAGARIREAVVGRLTALGYAPELQSGFVCRDAVCGSPVNIVATLGGSTGDKDAVMLAAHYDSVPAGPGASDDGAGVATLLEIARILAARPPPPHPIVLLLTDGEEAGLLGAQLFVRQHRLSRQVKAVVNLEARGTSGPSLMFETGTANTWLMRLYGSAVARPFTNSLYYLVYKRLPNDTDFSVFKAAYQGFNFAFIGDVGRYHTPLDSVANASAGSIQHQGDNALSALSALANSPTLHPPVGESVFFDGFARTLIAWPTEFALPAALLALALLLAEADFLLHKGAVAAREIMWGGVGMTCMLVLATSLCAGLLALAVAAGKVPPFSGASWISQPAPMQIAAAAIALLAAGGAGAWLSQRAGFWGYWMAASLGALPSTVSLMRHRTAPRWAADFAALFPALVIFASVLPLVRFLYMALGSLAWPVSTLVLGLGAAALLPLLASASRRVQRWVMAAAALFVMSGAALTLSLPTYSAEWPERINLEYWLDADTGQSHYLVRCDSLRLPPALAAAAHFDPVPRPSFAGDESTAFYAAAPKLALAAPALQPTPAAQLAVESKAADSAAHFDLRLRSLRGAPEALVVFPASAQVADIALVTAAGPVRATVNRLRNGATLLDIVSLPADGVEFSVDAAGRSPLVVQVLDQLAGRRSHGGASHRNALPRG